MRRTEVLQEIRKMRFEEAYGVWTEGRLSQEEAARMLGVCARTFRRYSERYEENGLEGLLDKRLTQISFRRAPLDEVMAVVDRYKCRHRGWNVKHFYGWYRRDGWGTAELHLGEEHASIGRVGFQSQETGRPSQASGTSSPPRNDAASGWKQS